jgi:hypothetical protein
MKKFRIWNNIDKGFVDESTIKLIPILLGKVLHGLNYEDIADMYLGITDIKGVEIFENDIVTIPGTGICKVEWSPHLGVIYRSANGDYVDHHDCVAENDHPTIIGNIHQHKDLYK